MSKNRKLRTGGLMSEFGAKRVSPLDEFLERSVVLQIRSTDSACMPELKTSLND